MINVVVLGANGALGECVVKLLKKNPRINLSVIVRKKELYSENKFFWDYKTNIPKELKEADVVINCARSKNFNFNIKFNSILINLLPDSVKIINISSNAIFAKPNGSFSKWLFRGDAYIREKKIIERNSYNHDNVIIIRPTIVTDEGSWKSFFDLCKNANQVLGPSDGNKSLVKITNRMHVAETIESCIFSQKEMPEELFQSLESIDKIIGKGLVYGKNSHNFFNSSFKNLQAVILSSWLIPDKLVFFLQSLLIKETKKLNLISNQEKKLIINGMTRFYLFGSHTK